MADSSSERRRSLSQPNFSGHWGQLAFHTTLPSYRRRIESKDGNKTVHHYHHLQVEQSHPATEVQKVNITRTKNTDAITPLPVHLVCLLLADIYHQLLL